MNLRTITFLIFTCFFYSVQAQKISLKGKVIDEKTGETLPGATILLKGSLSGTQSDLDGNFSFNNLSAGTYTLECRFISYQTKIIEGIKIKTSEPNFIQINLLPLETKLGLVEVFGTINKETTAGLLLMQQNSASVQDGVSSESIKRTPDRSTGDVLKRVSGASIQDNKFAIVRGLSDRYNAAYLNGSPLPSSEPDRKAFAFDIFPAAMLDNLIVTKTSTPDMPGEFAGGIIQINTKSAPENNFQSISLGMGFNSITTGKDRIDYQGGKFDWLGIDDGTRSLPKNIPAKESFPSGIDEQAKIAKTMRNDWALSNKKFLPNQNFQYLAGLNGNLFKKPLGFMFAITYNKSYNFIETSRRGYSANSVSGNNDNKSQLDFEYLDKAYAEQTLAGSLANFSMKFSDNHQISLKNIFSVNSDDRVIARTGETNPLEYNPTIIRSNARWFTGNRIYSGQLNGEHSFLKSKLHFKWNIGTSNIHREIPNLRRSVYTRYKTFLDPSEPNPKDTTFAANIAFANVGPSYGGGIFFSKTQETSYNGKMDLAYKINPEKENMNSEFKTGIFIQTRNRSFDARQLGYTRYAKVGGNIAFDDSLLFLSENEIFSNQNMGLVNPGKGGFKLSDGTKYSDSYSASSSLFAGYIMLDQHFYKKLRLIWGARIESFNQILYALKADRSELKLNTTKTDALPSANLIFALHEKQNLRLSYSQTLNRPEYRELAPFAFYDFNTNFVISGNDTLKRAKIQNFDLRYEYFPGRGQLISGSVFYKNFSNPIEQISRPDVTNEISFQNVNDANNYGIEIEFRQLLGQLLKKDSSEFLNNLTIFSNLSIVRSRVNVETITGSEQKYRLLQGQSPYIWNAGIQFIDNDRGHSFSASFNRVGPRIAIVGNKNEPSIWENSRTFIDIQLTKAFLKNKLEFKLNVQNILAQNQIFYQNRNISENKVSGVKSVFNQIFTGNKDNPNGLDKNRDDIIWNTRFGVVISFGASYRF